MTGRTVLHYKVGDLIGEGGMGQVYRAEDRRLGRQVALKFLPPTAQDDPERQARLLTEARAASSLQSPYIASTYDVGEYEGSLFIVMEYVRGELLSERLKVGPVALGDAVRYSMQVADALDEAHGRGVIHRDIKSANLIVTERGMVKVLDFGLAKFVGPQLVGATGAFQLGAPSEPTAPGILLGTVSYMSPEQALARTVDHRSDIFSLGVVMYELVAAHLPFTGDSFVAVIDAILHQDPPPLADRDAAEPLREYDRILRKAVAKSPEDRHQSAHDLYTELRSLRRRLEAMATLAETGYSLHAPSASGPHPLPAADRPSAAQGGAPPSPNTVAVMTFVNITREPADDWIGSGIAETVTADLKMIRGLTVIGSERIFEALRDAGGLGAFESSDERFAMGIGRRLGAGWIISGGYQRVGGVLRITARVVNTTDGVVMRTVKLDGQIGDIFALQDRIVFELSQGLNLELGRSEIAEIARPDTKSVEAFEAYSRGIALFREGTRDSIDRAINMFEQAVELDPDYALAWAALASAYDGKGSFLSLPRLSHKAIECAQKALALNPRLPQAHLSIGAAYRSVGRLDDAREHLTQAVKLDPSNAGARVSLARLYWLGQGRIDPAIEELEAAVALNREAGYALMQLTMLYTLRGDYQRAEEVGIRAVKLQERVMSGTDGLRMVGAYTRMGYTYYREKRFKEALREYQRERDYLDAHRDHILYDRATIELEAKIGAAMIRNGERAEGLEALSLAIARYEDRRAKGADDPFTKYYVAGALALRGDVEKAIQYLEESSATVGAFNRWRMRTDPDLEGIRTDLQTRGLLEEDGAVQAAP